MKLLTEIKLKKQDDNQINYHSKLLLLGSCFSENIGDKFNYYKFSSVINPFGILFHPKALEKLIVRALQQEEYLEKDVFIHNEQWHCFDAHSKLSNTSKGELLKVINSNLQLTNQQVCNSTHILITLGTAWVYNLVENSKTVANCHKLPQEQFNKNILSVDEIVRSLQNIIAAIEKVNQDVTIIFTVSPVRHIKDGFIENMQSKSHLITAVHKVLNTRVSYFPSYEIMLDELRDYRFYKPDMLHPNETAVEYIWQKFRDVWLSSKTKITMEEVDVIQKGLLHKAFNSNTKAHQLFLKKLNTRIMRLQKEHPGITF